MAIVNFVTSHSCWDNGGDGMEENRRKLLHVWCSNCSALLLWRCVVVAPQMGPTIRYNVFQIGLLFGK